MIQKAEIKAKNLRFANSTSIGMRAGQFLFLGSQTPMELGTGKLIRNFKEVPEGARRQLATGMLHTDITEERILVQAWQIYQNLKDILTEQNSSLDNVVRQRFFLQNMRDLLSLEKVILTFMPTERPATTIIEATNAGVNKEIAVQADFIALVPQEGIRRANISISDLDPLTAPYPLATKAGQFIFTSSMVGVNPETGRLVNHFEELNSEEREMLEPPYTLKGEAAVAQHLTIFRHFRRILESQGAPLGSHIHQNGWLRIPMQEFGSTVKIRRRLFAGQENMAGCTALPVSGIRREDAAFEYEIVALIPPKGPNEYRKETPMTAHPLCGFYLPAVKAGPFVFTSGEVAIETSVPCFVNKFSDLKDEGRYLPLGRVHEEKSIMPEAWFVYQKLKSYMEAHGSSMENVVHQSVFMVNPADYPALERIATLFYGSKLPPTSLVPIVGATPYPEAKLEIEVIALVT
jgi:enamine deaminase RidA (YjgF/YER057c/UK114 family)